MNIQEMDKKYIANTYARFPVVISEGKGSIVRDENGKDYIDLSTGIAVNTFGISDSKWKTAVIEQINKFAHVSNLYYTEPGAELARLLCKRTGMKKVFFSNSGAEANECAIKVARKYSADKYGRDRYKIISLNNSFHGRTITTLAATGQDKFHKDFNPLTQGFLYADVNIESIKNLIEKNKIAAIIIEIVQGEGGIFTLKKEFIEYIDKICKEKDILLIIDEIQTGNGRTGKLYAYMNYGIEPDIVTTAKGLAGGLPLGATLFNEKTQGVLAVGDHGTTFGGNPLACAGALSIIKRIDNDLLEEVKKKSRYIIEELSGAKGIKAVSGLGLMLGIEVEKDVNRVIEKCRQKGLLVIRAKDKIRLLPALNIPYDILERAIKILKEACIEA